MRRNEIINDGQRIFHARPLHTMEYAVNFTYHYSGGIRMSNVLKWSGYFAIITGVVIAIYIISSLKVIDISTQTSWRRHHRIPIAGFTQFSCSP
jgi:hypothetical protein